VAAAHRLDVPLDRNAEKGQVAEQIEQLVTDELIGKPQAVPVQDAAIIENDGVLKRTTEREADRL
jgi:hypothetical protein